MATSIGFNVFAHDRASGVFARISHSVSGLGKTAALALGGVAVGGVAALGAAMVQGVKDAEAYQLLGFKTAAVLKSTGNAAHQSVAGIQARAAALESMSGVDETLIINSQNVLATFTKVQDKVGKGNNIFTQGTRAALNLSTALGTDLQGATIQVGKALNDPIKGMTALRRVGVSFTQSQVDQVKAMVKAGDTMGAQKLILGELNKEFGGAAKAAGTGFAGSMARAKDAVGDAFRSIGTQLLPTLTRMADYIAANAGPAIAKLGAWMSTTLAPAIQKAAAAIGRFVSDFANGVGAAGLLRTALTLVGTALLGMAKFVGKNLDVLAPLVGIVVAARVAFVAITAVTKAWAIAQLFLNGALVANPIGLVIVALAAVAAAIVIAYKRSEKFREVVDTAFHGIAATARWLWNNVFAPVIRFILTGFAQLATAVAIFLHALGKIPGFGWATTAAGKMATAAAKARELAAGIRNIPNKTVTVTMRTGTAEQRLRAVLSYLASIHNKSVSLTVHYLNIGAKPQYQTGGYTGRGGHNQVAGIVHKGEYVMDAATVSKYGVGFMDALRGGTMAGTGTGWGVTAASAGTVIININGPTIGTPATIARQIQQALFKLDREA